jgi:hypothetical protein
MIGANYELAAPVYQDDGDIALSTAAPAGV